MTRILSTKILSPSQKDLLLRDEISFVEYNAISTEPIAFTSAASYTNAIVASKNAAEIIIKNAIEIDYFFCVGEKTAGLLKQHHKNVVVVQHSAKALGKYILEHHVNDAFVFFCGNIRRDELPDLLNKNHIALEEIPVYKTTLNPKEIEGSFDGILFFSPSAIESHIQKNKITDTIAFCIGNTTAKTVKKYTKNIVIAEQPTIEKTIVQALKYFAIK